MKLILASASPRRQEILHTLGFPFTVFPCDVDESLPAAIAPRDAVTMLAERKGAAACARLSDPDALILSADTVVAMNGAIYGKPHTAARAHEMLHAFSGGTHEVWTGISLTYGGKRVSAAECTHVFFRTLTDAEIDRYIAKESPLDKAGAYGIQGLASLFVEKIEGDYFNVVGLPMYRVARLAAEAFGIDLMALAASEKE